MAVCGNTEPRGSVARGEVHQTEAQPKRIGFTAPLNGRSGRKMEYGALYLRITRLILSLHGLLGFLRPLFCSVAGYLLEVVAESTVCVQDRLIICG